MTVALSLLAYGTVLALTGPRLIGALPAAQRAPRIGAVVWQVAAVSVVLSWALAGLAIAVAVPPLDGLGHLLTSCLAAVHEATAHPRSKTPQVVGFLLSAAVLGRAAACITAGAITRHRRRLQHAHMLRIVARPAPELRAVVLDHSSPMAYCLPGRLGQTVVTRGALDVLAPKELAAVLAHERAHLRARHDLALAPIQALARAFPRVPLLTGAARELPVLLEMCADDVAARRHGAAAVVGALCVLSSQRPPEGTLAAGGSTAQTRIDRLARPVGLRLRPRIALGSAAVLLAAGPLMAATAPVLVAAIEHLSYCPVPLLV